MLSAGVAANPAGLRAAKDRIAIAGWADLDAEVIKGYAALPSDARSDPAMIEAVARAYRNQKRFVEALDLYRKAQHIAPERRVFRIGETMVLGDLSDPAAVTNGELLVQDAPSEPDAHAALGYAYGQQGRTVDALRSHERELALAPARADLRRARIRSEEHTSELQSLMRTTHSL